jgi:hypothetical protein
MRNRTLTAGVVLLGAVALMLPACAMGGGGGGARGGGEVPQAQPGAQFMGGELELTKVEGPDGGEMTFTISNVSGKPLEDLTARVLFYLKPTGIQAYDTEAVEAPFSAFAEESIPITARPLNRTDILGWAVYVQPAKTVSREGGVRGTGSKFLGGALECTQIDDKLTALPPSISFVIENTSGETQELLEYEIVLTKEGQGSWRSGWMPIPGSIEPGETATITPDVSGSTVSGVSSVLLKIQRSVL